MWASGGNLTDSHTEELSLCALFLMLAAKKVDKEFSCHQSSAHTVRKAGQQGHRQDGKPFIGEISNIFFR